MGNICHAGPVPQTRHASNAGKPRREAPSPSPTFGRDAALKREDYIFSHLTTPRCLVKQPGSINGQQFLIENCRDCDIFLLDHCAAVQIDECANCRIVVGPCESSLFVRNCSDCTVVCAVQQFRARDCDGLDVYLYCATEPIIELSTKMRFACFPLTYFSLQQQFDKAGFSVWNNRWSEIFNFTPDHGGWKLLAASSHESPLAAVAEKQPDGAISLWKMPSFAAEDVGLTVDAQQLVVPLSSGMLARRDGEKRLFVVFVTPHSQLMLDFVHAMADTIEHPPDDEKRVLLIRTRQMKLSVSQAKALLPQNERAAQRAADASRDSAGSVVMEFQGDACESRVSAVLQLARFAGDAAVSSVEIFSDAQARRMCELVFVEWKETI